MQRIAGFFTFAFCLLTFAFPCFAAVDLVLDAPAAVVAGDEFDLVLLARPDADYAGEQVYGFRAVVVFDPAALVLLDIQPIDGPDWIIALIGTHGPGRGEGFWLQGLSYFAGVFWPREIPAEGLPLLTYRFRAVCTAPCDPVVMLVEDDAELGVDSWWTTTVEAVTGPGRPPGSVRVLGELLPATVYVEPPVYPPTHRGLRHAEDRRKR